MTLAKRALAPLLWLALVSSSPAQTNTNAEAPVFFYDHADETIHATVLENPLFHDAGAFAAKEGLLVSWLEQVPGKGDRIWLGFRTTNGWSHKTLVLDAPGDYANPTPTIDAKGRVWLSYEAGNTNGHRNVILRECHADGSLSESQQLNYGSGGGINHRVAADRYGDLWFVWQEDSHGQFDIIARRISGIRLSEAYTVSTSSYGNWEPALAITSTGKLNVAWDGYDGRNYQIYGRSFDGTKWGNVSRASSGAYFQARAQIASRSDGFVWMLWEEGGENWGQAYRGHASSDEMSFEVGDKAGPLHRFRKLHLEEFAALSYRRIEIPMPSLALAAARTNAPRDVKCAGAFYESGQVVVDGKGRPWITYRHFYAPRVGIVPERHEQDSWMLYARCLLDDHWSKLYSFDVGQSDGLQRLVVVPEANGITAVWTTGRVDRHKTAKPQGVALATISLPGNAKGIIPVTSFGSSRNVPEVQPDNAPHRAH